MEKIRKSIFTLLATIAMITLLAFMPCHRYSTIVRTYTNSKNKIKGGSSNSIRLADLELTTNWSSPVTLPSVGASDFLLAMQYDNTELSFEQARQAVKDFYNETDSLPANGGIVTKEVGGEAFIVTIYRAAP